MRVQQMPVFLLLGLAVTVGACQPAKNKPPELPPEQTIPTTKPEAVNVVHVGIVALSEVSHIERAIKPMFGVKLSTAPPPLGETADVECRSTESTNLALRETTWKCGLDPKLRGRKEIEGVERVNYDQKARLITYTADFATRNFDDLEPRANAHTVVTSRKIKIRFEKGSTDAAGRATLVMESTAALKGTLGTSAKGSNYTARISGILLHQGTTWTLTTNSILSFEGALYGVDGERKTQWAAGRFTFVPRSNINLVGLGEEKCTVPVGPWKVSAVGGGNKFDTTLETSETGGGNASGSTLAWPVQLCDQP